jgi:hypothetical protein
MVDQDIPGWTLRGADPEDYDFGVDEHVTRDGAPVAFIRNRGTNSTGWTALIQTISAERFRDRRFRFRGWLSTIDAGWAGLWARVDEPGGHESAFDNMSERALVGTSEWQQADVVLDVRPSSAAIAFGVILDGPGEVRVSSLSLELVGPDVPVTEVPLRLEPHNLDFAEL